MAERLTTLAKRLRPFIAGMVGGMASGGAFVTEGPGIDIVGQTIGLGGDTVLLYDSGGNPVAEYAATGTGIALALAAAGSGDTVEFPSITIALNVTLGGGITIPAGVTLKGINRERSILTFSGDATGTYNVITVSDGAVLSDCTINATYTGDAVEVRTVFLVTGKAYRLRINSTKLLGTGDLVGMRGTIYETTTSVEESVVDVVSIATTSVDYMCKGIYLLNIGNDAGKRGIVRNLYGYAILDSMTLNHHRTLTGLQLDGDATDIYIRSNEDYADYTYYSVGDNAQAYDCYGYAWVQNADAAGGASATGLDVNTLTVHSCNGYAVSDGYSLGRGISADFATLVGCIGHAKANTSYLEDYERVIGISTDGQCAFYNCVGVAEDTGASSDLITDGFYAGDDVLIGCTAKAVSTNGTANDIEFYAYCYLSGTNFSRFAWFDPNVPEQLYPLNGDRNFNAFHAITADTTLTQEHDVILADATSGNVVITLPKAANYKRRVYQVKRIDGTANTVTIEGDGAETIDDAANVTLAQYEFTAVISDGSEWWTIPPKGHNPITLDADAGAIFDITIQELGLDVQNANTVLAGPTTGAANEPTFRALVLADLPDINLDDLADVDTTGVVDGAALIYDSADQTWKDSILIRDDGTNAMIGNASDYLNVDGDGTITMVGDARVAREIRVEVGRARAGESAPTATTRAVGASGGVRVPVDQFSKVTQQDVYFEIHAPSDMDGTEDVTFHLMWFPGASWSAGNYLWKLEYIITDETGVELNAEAPTTISADTTPTAATNVIETEFTTAITGFDVEKILWCHFYRDVAGDNGDDVGEVRWFEIEYVMNKLGEKLSAPASLLIDENGDQLIDENGDELTD